MTWAHWHAQSESKATEADAAERQGLTTVAAELRHEAACHEFEALKACAIGKSRTAAITACSAFNLFVKCGDIDKAREVLDYYKASPTCDQQLIDALEAV